MSETAPSAPAFDHHRGVRPLLRQTSTLRGVFFVGANLAGFVVASAFVHYLQTGRWLEFTVSAYRKSLAVPLSDMLLRPLSIFSHPWMIVVTGLLIAAVAFVPVMVAVLYRLWVSGLFVLVVAVFAHSPVLAGCLALGCVIAGRTRLRSNLPFLALLAGLLSAGVLYVLLYYLFFSRLLDVGLLPLQRPVFCLPLILALVAAVPAGAWVLGLARGTHYRPGVIWPALLVLLVPPLLLFYAKVGPAELEYALLAGRIAPGEAVFASARVEDFRRSHGAGKRTPAGGPELLAAARADLDRRRAELSAQCEDFLRRHRNSQHRSAVMFILHTVRDVQLDPEAFDRGLIRHLYVGPSPQSVGAWRDLTEQFPFSPQAGVARFRMAVVALRQERVQEAWRLLNDARSPLAGELKATDGEAGAGVWKGVFAPLVSLPGREYYRAALEEVQRVVWLMEANKVLEGTPENIRAFADYMRLWPFVEVSPAQLTELAAGSENTELADNFRLQAAMAETDLFQRAGALTALAQEVNDSAVVANYELGRLTMLRGPVSPTLKTAQEYFKVVVSAPLSPYREPAEQHLAWLSRRKEAAP